MKLLGDVLKELLSMFLADGWPTAGVLILVAIIGVLAGVLRIQPLLAGGVLVLGCLAILVGAAEREAKRRGRE